MDNGSLLSLEIAQFYKNIPIEENDNFISYFDNKLCYDFGEIAKLILLPQQKYQDLDYFSYEDCLKCHHRLLPVFAESEKKANELRSSRTMELDIKVSWLGINSKFVEYLMNAKGNLPTVEFILLTTALMEKALADIFLKQSGEATRPHLLKDLLATPELLDFFGTEAMLFLRLLLGLPQSINLRNIVWHGFPQPNEIPDYYAATLLLLVHSLGCLLEAKRYEHQEGKYFEYPKDKVDKIVLPSLEVKHTMELVGKCTWLHREHKKYWQQIFAYYENNLSWLLVLLILPQIELLLRIKYGRANNLDVCAKLNEYYITMDTILEATVPHRDDTPNLLLTTTSPGVLNCIYDYFVALSGPRIRDKLSHGETILETTSENNEHVLMLIATSLLAEQGDHDPLANYGSELHLNSLTKHHYELSCEKLKKLTMKYNTNKQHNESILLHNIKIFSRPKKEREFMNILCEILVTLHMTVREYDEAIESRLKLLKNKKLHSKRRGTLKKTLETLPNTADVMYEILESCKTNFLRLQKDDRAIYYNAQLQKQLLKFLKSTLTICQRLNKYLAKQSNEWIKAVDVCDRFLVNRDLYAKFYDNVQNGI